MIRHGKSVAEVGEPSISREVKQEYYLLVLQILRADLWNNPVKSAHFSRKVPNPTRETLVTRSLSRRLDQYIKGWSSPLVNHPLYTKVLSMADTVTRNILIVGGGVAGISEAHFLLRHVLPSLHDQFSVTFKLTLLSPSSHFYWKVGAPRGLVNPSLISLRESFIPIADSFRHYGSAHFNFVQGTASHLDAVSKNIQIRINSDELSNLEYDILVIATGTTSSSPLYSLVGSHDKTERALRDMHGRLPRAQSILIAGGGPVGTETAGELGSEYGNRPESEQKEITILSGHSRLLPRLNAKTSADSEAKLA